MSVLKRIAASLWALSTNDMVIAPRDVGRTFQEEEKV